MADRTGSSWMQMPVAEREIAFSPSSALPDGDLSPYLKRYSDLSQQAYAAAPNLETLRYGSGPAHTLDLVRPAGLGPHPLLVFIHGGYWQQLSKRESLFPAPDCVSRGMAYAALDYPLAPDATLDEIVEACTRAVTMLFQQASTLSIDPTRIVLSGSSAGAHLVAMLCTKLSHNHRPHALALLSGVYDLAPLVGTYINEAVGMDLDVAARNSPAKLDLSRLPKALLAWGEIETDAFKEQSRTFGAQLKDAELLECPGRNHFDIVEDLSNDSLLGTQLRGLFER